MTSCSADWNNHPVMTSCSPNWNNLLHCWLEPQPHQGFGCQAWQLHQSQTPIIKWQEPIRPAAPVTVAHAWTSWRELVKNQASLLTYAMWLNIHFPLCNQQMYKECWHLHSASECCAAEYSHLYGNYTTNKCINNISISTQPVNTVCLAVHFTMQQMNAQTAITSPLSQWNLTWPLPLSSSSPCCSCSGHRPHSSLPPWVWGQGSPPLQTPLPRGAGCSGPSTGGRPSWCLRTVPLGTPTVKWHTITWSKSSHAWQPRLVWWAPFSLISKHC